MVMQQTLIKLHYLNEICTKHCYPLNSFANDSSFSKFSQLPNKAAVAKIVIIKISRVHVLLLATCICTYYELLFILATHLKVTLSNNISSLCNLNYAQWSL